MVWCVGGWPDEDGTKEGNTMTRREAEAYIETLSPEQKWLLNDFLASLAQTHPREEAPQASAGRDD